MRDCLLTARCGVMNADGLAGIDRIDAVAHADAGSDLGFAPLGHFERDMRIGQMRARHANHIQLAAFDCMASGRDVLDAGGVKRRQARLGAHLAREVEMRRRALAHARNHTAQALLAVDMATDHVEEVDQSRPRQLAGDGHAFFPAQPALPVLVADQPGAYQEIGTHAPAHRLEHGHSEPEPIVDRAAIFVLALVGRGRPKLIDEMAVALDFKAIESACLHPLGGVGVGRDHPTKVPVLHGLGEGAMRGLADMGGRDDREPIVFAPSCAAPEMRDLDHHRRALSVDVVGQFLQPRHALIFIEKDIAERLGAVRRHHRRTADHGQCDAAPRLFGVVEAVALFGHAVVGIGRFMRGRHQPVAQRQAAKLKGLQQWVVGHTAASNA